MKKRMLRPALIALLAIAPLSAQRNPGNLLTQLPSNIEVLTHFGERADISPDNQRIAFMNKSFGDAFVVDLKTKIIQCLTCSVPGTAFLRIMHLPSGDYMVIGPEHFTDIRTSRRRDNELWFLSKKPGSKPVKLGQRMSEGMAISKKDMKIAYSVLPAGSQPHPVAVAALRGRCGYLRRNAAHREQEDGVRKASPPIAASKRRTPLFDNDRKMTFTCYEPKGLASVMTLDMTNGKAENQSKAPGTYNECEGVFPDG